MLQFWEPYPYCHQARKYPRYGHLIIYMLHMCKHASFRFVEIFMIWQNVRIRLCIDVQNSIQGLGRINCYPGISPPSPLLPLGFNWHSTNFKLNLRHPHAPFYMHNDLELNKRSKKYINLGRFQWTRHKANIFRCFAYIVRGSLEVAFSLSSHALNF